MREVEIKLAPEDKDDESIIRQSISKAAKIAANDIKDYRLIRRSLDARYRPPVYLIRALVSTDEKLPALTNELDDLPNVSNSRPVHIIGAGPAGYFAALELIGQGLRPIVIERGKDVQSRRKDLRAIQQDGIVNPHSNYCFGEGGAGTYSDGKLYTRSTKRGNIESVLKILVECGANHDILIDSHPHIGSNKLPQIIAAMRKVIEDHGGKVLFNAWVSDIVITESSARKIKSLRINNDEIIDVENVILAAGHSARDIFQLLVDKHVAIESFVIAMY